MLELICTTIMHIINAFCYMFATNNVTQDHKCFGIPIHHPLMKQFARQANEVSYVTEIRQWLLKLLVFSPCHMYLR